MSWLIGIAIISAILIVFIRRGLQMKELAHRGVVVQGNVIRKFRRTSSKGRSSHAYLTYEFSTSDGAKLDRTIAVGEEVFESHAEGDRIDIVYVPGRPKINGAKYMVNLSREALKLPPL